MTTNDILEKLANVIRQLNSFYGELSQELPNLRVVVDNTREFSELKKMLRKSLTSRALITQTKHQTTIAI